MNISQKLLVPSILLIVVGLLLVVIASLLADGDPELRALGLGALGSGIAALAVGSRIPPAPGVEQAEVNEISRRRRL